MSRSYKKNNYSGNTTASSDKASKQQFARKERRYVATKIASEDWQSAELADSRMFGSDWDTQKDGKFYFDEEDYPELKRK